MNGREDCGEFLVNIMNHSMHCVIVMISSPDEIVRLNSLENLAEGEMYSRELKVGANHNIKISLQLWNAKFRERKEMICELFIKNKDTRT